MVLLRRIAVFSRTLKKMKISSAVGLSLTLVTDGGDTVRKRVWLQSKGQVGPNLLKHSLSKFPFANRLLHSV